MYVCLLICEVEKLGQMITQIPLGYSSKDKTFALFFLSNQAPISVGVKSTGLLFLDTHFQEQEDWILSLISK